MGEATPVEQRSAEAKSLKTKGQGTVWLPLKWAIAEAARRGASGPNERATLTTYLLKKRELKAALHWNTTRGKGGLPRKKQHSWKERNAYSRLQKLGAEGKGGEVDEGVEDWEPTRRADHKSSGPNKRATLTTYLLKKRELKAALHWSTKRAKSSLPRHGIILYRRLRYCYRYDYRYPSAATMNLHRHMNSTRQF